jgi:hypothetical protein
MIVRVIHRNGAPHLHEVVGDRLRGAVRFSLEKVASTLAELRRPAPSAGAELEDQVCRGTASSGSSTAGALPYLLEKLYGVSGGASHEGSEVVLVD